MQNVTYCLKEKQVPLYLNFFWLCNVIATNGEISNAKVSLLGLWEINQDQAPYVFMDFLAQWVGELWPKSTPKAAYIAFAVPNWKKSLLLFFPW